jgi:hypothetical protein
MPEESSSAAPDVRLGPARLRIIRGMQPSAARRETAECAARHSPVSTAGSESLSRQAIVTITDLLRRRRAALLMHRHRVAHPG